uniref:Uncharacterized protein n=1 Tax=Macrostomum lignano TaxID=282301 RepID=A0A1I8JKH6_9PLAT
MFAAVHFDLAGCHHRRRRELAGRWRRSGGCPSFRPGRAALQPEHREDQQPAGGSKSDQNLLQQQRVNHSPASSGVAMQQRGRPQQPSEPRQRRSEAGHETPQQRSRRPRQAGVAADR